MWAKQSTAATLIVGPILDSTGAEYTGAVIGDLSISKNGGTLTAMASAATLTHIANGQYTLVTTTGNTDTLGRAQITCNKSTYQMPFINLMIVPAMIFDSVVLGTDRFDTNVTHVADTAQTAGDIIGDTNDIQSRLPAALGANGNMKADVRDSIGVAIFNEDFTIASATSSTVTLPTTYSSGTSLPDDDRYQFCTLSIVGGTGVGQMVYLTSAAAGARVYNVDTSTMVVQLDNTSRCVVIDSARANATHFAGQTITCAGGVTIPAATLASTTNITAGTITTATNVTTVNGLAANVITAAAIADGAIDRATFAADTGLQTIRSNTAAGGASASITLDGSASATNNYYNDCLVYLTGGTGVGQVRRIRSYTGSSKVAATTPAWTTIPDNTSTFAITPAMSVWNEITGDHVASTTTGASLNAAGSAGDPWTTALPGAYGAGTAGFIIGTNVDALITSRLAPTVAGRTLDVSVGGEAGLDWANIGTPGATVGLSATTMSAVTTVATTTNVTTVNGLAANVVTAASLAVDAGSEIAAAVWDLATVGHTTSGTFGAAMNAAGAAGDPWSTSLPGAYGAGTAGHIVGTSLPDIAPGSANGLLRGGTNSATTVNITGTISTVTNLTNAPTSGDFTATMKTSLNAATPAVTVSDKTGFSLASTGLNLVVPSDPSAKPVLGTANIATWIGWFGAWSVNEVDSTSVHVKLRNSADSADLVTHLTSDDGTTFINGGGA